MVARGGVEPPTFRFSVGRSYQLSYLANEREAYRDRSGPPNRPEPLLRQSPEHPVCTGPGRSRFCGCDLHTAALRTAADPDVLWPMPVREEISFGSHRHEDHLLR